MVKIILAGGGDEEQSKITDKFYLSKLGDNTKMLYIPIALRDHILFEDCLSWISNVFPSIKNNIKMITDFNEISEEDIKNYDTIYISGGNTYNLLSEINNSDFREKINQFISQDKMIYGGSAGAIVLGENILTSPDSNETKLTDFSGIKIIKNYSIWPHYKEKNNLDISDYVKKYNLNVIAIPEESSLYVENNTGITIGTKEIVIFMKDNSIIRILPNEKITLK
jgi:dipeptidase E